MSNNIEWVLNNVATGFITGTDNFIYNFTPSYAEQPDAMIIRQITASTNVSGTANVTSLLTFNLYSDIVNQNIGCVSFSYNCSGVANANNVVTFNSNPQTYVKIYKPCLLYTSPSPRDGLLSRMPSSA